ncbi:tyrosine-protein phosphatase [Microbulbifer elongatus]|uniref:tyrosine-protein phosphatase n=1 Tax=Microbulbifer elongatus TaxID=86173 RepID=UPI001CFCF93F|nr:CpsB/CapC family capsule biosynthesis tyrosine phosphatase [Microbulbifer elongatus]
MIDLHCHLLPGVDDGAKDLQQALTLAQMSVAQGVTHAVMTPHIHVGRYQNDYSSIERAFLDLRDALSVARIPLRIGFAAEVRIGGEIPVMIRDRRIPFLGTWEGMRVLLLELPYHTVPPEAEHFVTWLIKNNIRPLIAHPERNKGILRDFNRIFSLARLGCLFQITAGSVTGAFGEPVQRCAEKLLKTELVTVMATDTHHPVRRPPILGDGRRAAEKILGESSAWDLVLNNPGRIAAGQFSRLATQH